MDLKKVELITPPTNSYALAFSCVPGAIAANNTLLSFLNPATSTIAVKVRRILLDQLFYGTAGATAAFYALRRFNHATGYTGGAAGNPAKMTGTVNPQAVCRYAGTGSLVDPGVSVQGDLGIFAGPNQLVSAAQFDFDFSDIPMELNPGEGFSISTYSAILASTAIDGSIQWSEA